MINKYSTNEHPDDYSGDLYEERQIEKESKKMNNIKSVLNSCEELKDFKEEVERVLENVSKCPDFEDDIQFFLNHVRSLQDYYDCSDYYTTIANILNMHLKEVEQND